MTQVTWIEEMIPLILATRWSRRDWNYFWQWVRDWTPSWTHLLWDILRGDGFYLALLVLILIYAYWPPRLIREWKAKHQAPPAPSACTGCGYDLTGNESGACPECGQSTWRRT